MRILDFSDGFTSTSEPLVGSISANNLQDYASDAAFIAAKGSIEENGDSYYNTTSNQIRAYINGAWREVLANDRTQVITNKDIDGGTASNTSRLTVPSANKSALDALTRKAGTIVYATDQSKFYGDNGSVLAGIGGGGGGSSLFWLENAEAPTTVIVNNMLHYDFAATMGQSLYAQITVPTSYTAGQQITLKIKFYSADTTGNALMQSVSTLIRDSDLVTTTTNQRTSTNAAVSLSGSTQNKYQSVTLDLTSSIGQINAISLAAGHTIMVRLTRGTDTATGSLLVPVYGAEPIFSV